MLKQALQPSIHNVSVEWKVPSADLSQTPTKIPLVFAGSRLVVFGVPKLTSSSKDMCVDCEAILHYQQGKERKSLSVHFTLSPSKKEDVAGDVDAYPIHRLAGKQLLQEVAKKNNKEELVRVSLETGVVCEETAFVAVAEDGEEAVTGALERQTIPVSIRIGSDGLAACACPAMLSCSGPSLSDVIRRRVGSRLSAIRHAFSAASARVSDLFSSKTKATSSATDVQSANDVASSEDVSAGVNRGSVNPTGDFEKEGEDKSAGCKASLPTEEEEEERQPAQSSGTSHLAVISLQQFSGAWHLNEALAEICGQSLSHLRASLPTSLSSPDKESVWATLLAVALLKHRHGDAEEEWELVVEKAMSWVKGCLASTSESVDELLKIAKSML